MKHFSCNWRNQAASMSSDQHSDLYRHLSGNNKNQEHFRFVTNPPTCKASACSTRKHNLCQTWLCAPEAKPRLHQMAQSCSSLVPCLDLLAQKGGTCWGRGRRGRRMPTAGTLLVSQQEPEHSQGQCQDARAQWKLHRWMCCGTDAAAWGSSHFPSKDPTTTTYS